MATSRMISRRSVETTWEEWVKILRNDPEDVLAVKEFESAFARWLQLQGAVAFPSGRAALIAALQCLPHDRKNEVILPAYTLRSLVPVIEAQGFSVRFADIEPDTYNISARTLEPMLSSRTLAVIGADIFGNPCDAPELAGLCSDADAYFVEDAAHAAGSMFRDRPVGFFADAAFFSFDTIKPIRAFGGGAVVALSEEFLNCVRGHLPSKQGRKLPVVKRMWDTFAENRLQSTPLYPLAVRLLATAPLRRMVLDAYMKVRDRSVPDPERRWLPAQASMALKGLRQLPERVAAKRAVAQQLIDALEDRIDFQQELPQAESNRYFLVGIPKEHPLQARKRLIAAGIDTGYGEEITDFCPSPNAEHDAPNAEQVYRHAIQLPCYETMDDATLDRLIDRARKALKP